MSTYDYATTLKYDNITLKNIATINQIKIYFIMSNLMHRQLSEFFFLNREPTQRYGILQ